MSGPQGLGPASAAPLRVLHCYTGNMFGGVETALLTLAQCRHLAPGMVPEFALCFEGRLADELRAAGVLVRILGAVRFRHPWNVLRARVRMRRLLATTRPDVVICHDSWPYALLGRVIRRAGVPLVCWIHGQPTGALRHERRAGRVPPDLVLVNSRFMIGEVPRLFRNGAVRMLPYPVSRPPAEADPATARAAVRRELGTDPGAVVIVMHSRLSPYKGHVLLLEALARLARADRTAWETWVVGGPQQPSEETIFAELQAQARALGLAGRVRFLGQRYDIPRLLAAADVHCQPNTGPEPFGIAWIEALYAGLPVVSTRIGGAAEIVTEACGVLVEPGDVAGLAAALDGLIADPETRARLGSAGPARASALTDPHVTMPRLHALLAEALAISRGPAPAGPSRATGRNTSPSRGCNT